jgi:hypothetical protein
VAVYQFSALSDGQSISFNPNADRLNFDQPEIAGADLRVGAAESNVVVTHVATGKEVTLLNMAPNQLAAANFTLTSASLALFGDNSLGTAGDAGANVLTGGSGRDLLMGFGGNDTLGGGTNGDDWLDAHALTGVGDNGRFASGDVRFHSGAGVTTVHDADDRIISNTSTGQLYYDANGNAPEPRNSSRPSPTA